MCVPGFELMGVIKCGYMGVSSCFWMCFGLDVRVSVCGCGHGCVFVCGLEHYTFSPLSV